MSAGVTQPWPRQDASQYSRPTRPVPPTTTSPAHVACISLPPATLTAAPMQRSLVHVPRRSAAAMRRRAACPARALSSALSPDQNSVTDFPALVHTALDQAAGVAKPSKSPCEDANRVQRVHALRRASAPALRDLRSPAGFSTPVEPTAKASASDGPESQHEPEPEQNGDGEISDQEWEIRTGAPRPLPSSTPCRTAGRPARTRESDTHAQRSSLHASPTNTAPYAHRTLVDQAARYTSCSRPSPASSTRGSSPRSRPPSSPARPIRPATPTARAALGARTSRASIADTSA